MKKRLKIAIYSGEIPSTTFIERLINGLSKNGELIYLFGAITKKTDYPPTVKVVAYSHQKLRKLLHLAIYSLLLFLFKHKDKNKLDAFLKATSKNLLYSKVKCYPVLWYQPDIFHVQWAKGLEEWAWVSDFGMKLVLSLRGAHINYSPIADAKLVNMYRENFPNVAGFHAVSKAIGQEAQNYGARKELIKVVYSGLDLSIQKKPQKMEHSCFHIVSVGRPHWVKGYTYALDACKILKDRDIKFHYSIIGGADDIELSYQVNDLNLSKEVTLLEKHPYLQVQDLIHDSDVLLLSSVKEGVANVVLEAMALRTLVLSTDCGGMTEVITKGKNGFLVPIRDSRAMAQKLMEISQLPESEKSKMTEAAMQTLYDQHTETKMLRDMLALYQSVLT